MIPQFQLNRPVFAEIAGNSEASLHFALRMGNPQRTQIFADGRGAGGIGDGGWQMGDRMVPRRREEKGPTPRSMGRRGSRPYQLVQSGRDRFHPVPKWACGRWLRLGKFCSSSPQPFHRNGGEGEEAARGIEGAVWLASFFHHQPISEMGPLSPPSEWKRGRREGRAFGRWEDGLWNGQFAQLRARTPAEPAGEDAFATRVEPLPTELDRTELNFLMGKRGSVICNSCEGGYSFRLHDFCRDPSFAFVDQEGVRSAGVGRPFRCAWPACG